MLTRLKISRQTREIFIKSSIESGEYGSHILVVPTGKMLRKWSNFAVKEYFESTGKPGTELPFFNLKGLVQSLYNYLFPGKGHFISDAYRLALFEEAVEKSNLDFSQMLREGLAAA
jgi:hypothetical protein